MTARVAVLASGGGSNLQALLDHLAQLGSARAGEVVLVASDRESSGALERARARGILAGTIPRPADADFLDALLREHGIDLVVLAGYLRLVPAGVVQRYGGRMLNVHPALLPAFGGPGMYGARVHRAVLASGARVTGVTVHAVDEIYDHGAILAQWPVPVLTGDTPESLAARVLRVEHLLYPRVVNAVAAVVHRGAAGISVRAPAGGSTDPPGRRPSVERGEAREAVFALSEDDRSLASHFDSIFAGTETMHAPP